MKQVSQLLPGLAALRASNCTKILHTSPFRVRGQPAYPGSFRQSYHCVKNTITSTQPTLLPWRFGLYQRPSSEEVCSIPLPVLAT